jgi:hypothetical protein
MMVVELTLVTGNPPNWWDDSEDNLTAFAVDNSLHQCVVKAHRELANYRTYDFAPMDLEAM